MAKTKILVFGNSLVEEDSLPLRLLPWLRRTFPNVEFKELDAVEQLEDEGRNLVILDSAHGINKVMLLEGLDNLDKIESSCRCSMHDFDLGLTLKLLKKMKKLDSVRIIAVPIGYGKKKALAELSAILSSLS